MAPPYTIIVVNDVTIGGTDSIINGESGRTLVAPSRVQIFLNRESVDVTFTITLGGARILLDGAARINATVGDIPVLPDDGIADTFGGAGDELVILASNVNAALQEARAIIRVTEIDDNALAMAMQTLGMVSQAAFA